MNKKTTRKHFDFYGYNSPTSGKFWVNGEEFFYGEDYRNKKRYKEYKKVGFNILLLQHENSYRGEEFSTSAQNLCIKEALKAGIKKIIVSDTRLKDLCIQDDLISQNGKFKNEQELDKYVFSCIKPYYKQKGVFGIQLFDEPKYKNLLSYGQVYKSIKRVFPKCYLQCNLFNIVESSSTAGREIPKLEAYEIYLNSFLDNSSCDYILFDEYPFRKNYIIGGHSIPAYQIATKICKERNIEFKNVFQTWSWINTSANGVVQNFYRRVFEGDLYWQLNMLLGFGCKEFAFFTYFTKQNVSLGENTHFHLDGASLVNRDGTRSALYYQCKKIISQIKKIEKHIIDYSFDNSYFFCESGKTTKDFMQTEFVFINENCPINVSVSHGVALVTHLKKDGHSLFMIQNINNLKEDLTNKMQVEYSINLLGQKCKKIYSLNVKDYKICENGQILANLKYGEAIFIEI